MLNYSLLSLEQAKTQLRILSTDTTHDDDIEEKIVQASVMVLRRMKMDSVPQEWIVNNSPVTLDVPADVRGYTAAITSELFENREASVFNIENILKLLDSGWRTPTLG